MVNSSNPRIQKISGISWDNGYCASTRDSPSPVIHDTMITNTSKNESNVDIAAAAIGPEGMSVDGSKNIPSCLDFDF